MRRLTVHGAIREGQKKLGYIVHTNNSYISLIAREWTRQTHREGKLV